MMRSKLLLAVMCGTLWGASYAEAPKEKVVASLQFMQEEEKLAHDVYGAFYTQWKLPIFANIQRSEQQHMDALSRFSSLQGKTMASLSAGHFEDAELQAMYDQLVKKGMTSVTAALQASALVEEKDIADLDQKILEKPPEELRQTYERLRAASWRHLASFVRNLERQGLDYQPQILNQQRYSEMLSAAKR